MPLRILHFHFGREGGAERFFVNLATAFAKRGVQQQFFIRPHRTWESEISCLGRVTRNNFSMISPLTLLAHIQAEWVVRSWKPDAVMAWMPRAGRLMHRWPNTIKLARMGDFPANLKHFGNCDVLVGNLPDIAARCKELGWQKPVVTISNFVLSRPDNTSPRNLPVGFNEQFIVAASGRFVERKGFDTLIKAIALTPQTILWLIGDGPDAAKLAKLSQELGISDRVVFWGWVNDPGNIIKKANAFVMPSRHEPLGNALLEAWAIGIPTVSTRSEGPSWYMRDQIDGILTDIDDVRAISDALNCIKSDPIKASRFVENARERLDAMFSEESVTQSYFKIFRGEINEFED